MGDVTMCHHYERESWTDERVEDEPTADVDAEDDDWVPDEFEEERETEVSLLTDGGDEA
ncbi:hypothetical protein [Haloplanus salilacus]|uniref:hypothetical protein n=1 Tax=Haloplanus salilacus TaxID=2949994 RepID=UPI0030CECD00